MFKQNTLEFWTDRLKTSRTKTVIELVFLALGESSSLFSLFFVRQFYFFSRSPTFEIICFDEVILIGSID